MEAMAEGVISKLVARGVEKITSRKKITSQDLTVLLLHQQSSSLAKIESGMGSLPKIESAIGSLPRIESAMGSLPRIESGVVDIAGELKELRGEFGGFTKELSEFRRELVPLVNMLVNMARDIAEIKSRLERIESGMR